MRFQNKLVKFMTFLKGRNNSVSFFYFLMYLNENWQLQSLDMSKFDKFTLHKTHRNLSTMTFIFSSPAISASFVFAFNASVN